MEEITPRRRDSSSDKSDSSRIHTSLSQPYPLSSSPSSFSCPIGLCPWRSRQRLVDLHLVISRPTSRRAESRRHRSTTPFHHSTLLLPFVISSSFRFIDWNVRSVVPACLPLDTLDSRVNGIILKLRSFFLSVCISLSFSLPLAARKRRRRRDAHRIAHRIYGL